MACSFAACTDIAQGLQTSTTGHHGQVTGNHNYHFSLAFEPRSEDGGLCQTGVLVAMARTQQNGGQPVPIVCRWLRRTGAHLAEIQGVAWNTYHTSADDIGSTIICEAHSSHDTSFGLARGIIGPFELDPTDREHLRSLIASGGTRFPVRLASEQGTPLPRDPLVYVREDNVKVVHMESREGSDGHRVAWYSSDYPKVAIDPLDTCRFRLELGADDSAKFDLLALSRRSRDHIALLIRTFHSRRRVANFFLISLLSLDPLSPVAAVGRGSSASSYADFDIYKLSQDTISDLNFIVAQRDALLQTCTAGQTEITNLGLQLQETLTGYTDAIEVMHHKLGRGRCKALQAQLADAHAGLAVIHEQSKRVSKQVEDGASNAFIDEAAALEKAAKVKLLKAEIDQLRQGILAHSSERERQGDREVVRSKELDRLRLDYNSLRAEKEALELCLAEQSSEKLELIDRFLSVKNTFDKVQFEIAKKATEDLPPERAMEMLDLRLNYTQITEERNRLRENCEAMDRDSVRSKREHERQIERLSETNARILEERDRLHAELARVSTLYTSTLAAFSGSGLCSGAKTVDDTVVRRPHELREELTSKLDRLRELREHGEVLSTRLHKLAASK